MGRNPFTTEDTLRLRSGQAEEDKVDRKLPIYEDYDSWTWSGFEGWVCGRIQACECKGFLGSAGAWKWIGARIRRLVEKL
jgi:hypothetical protein